MKSVLKVEHWSRACLATLTFYTACGVRVSIFSTGGKFRHVSIFTQLHALTLVPYSYVLLQPATIYMWAVQVEFRLDVT